MLWLAYNQLSTIQFLSAECAWDGSLRGNVLVQLRQILWTMKNLSKLDFSGESEGEKRESNHQSFLSYSLCIALNTCYEISNWKLGQITNCCLWGVIFSALSLELKRSLNLGFTTKQVQDWEQVFVSFGLIASSVECKSCLIWGVLRVRI